MNKMEIGIHMLILGLQLELSGSYLLLCKNRLMDVAMIMTRGEGLGMFQLLLEAKILSFY